MKTVVIGVSSREETSVRIINAIKKGKSKGRIAASKARRIYGVRSRPNVGMFSGL